MTRCFRPGGGAVSRLHHRLRSSDGMVTAEIAVGILTLTTIAISVFAMVLLGAEQVRIVESARTAARMVARGQTTLEAEELVVRTVPASHVKFDERGTDVVVTVSRQVEPIALLPALTLHATAVTPAEVPDEG